MSGGPDTTGGRNAGLELLEIGVKRISDGRWWTGSTWTVTRDDVAEAPPGESGHRPPQDAQQQVERQYRQEGDARRHRRRTKLTNRPAAVGWGLCAR